MAFDDQGEIRVEGVGGRVLIGRINGGLMYYVLL